MIARVMYMDNRKPAKTAGRSRSHVLDAGSMIR